MITSSVSSASAGGVFTSSRWNDQVRTNIHTLLAPPMARVRHTSTQECPSGVWTALAFNTEVYDTDDIHSTASNSSRLTCQTNGVYEISGYAGFAVSSAGLRGLRVLLNDSTTTVVLTDLRAAVDTYPHSMTVSAQYPLTTGQYVTLQAYQNSGSTAVDLLAADSAPSFSMAWLGHSTAF